MISLHKIFLATAFLLCPQSMLFAGDIPQPAGPVILTISGELENVNSPDGLLKLDIDMLKTMPVITFKTKTIWLQDAVEFTGVSLKDVLDFAGASGALINAIALNDYKVDIPLQDVEEGVPIIAYLLDGKEMSPRDKGPLWIVYPYDQDAKYRSEVIYSRSIWQLDRLASVK